MTSPSQPLQMSVARNSPTCPSFGKAGTHRAGEEDLSQAGCQANHASEAAGDATLVAQSRSTTPVWASSLLASHCCQESARCSSRLGSRCHADLHLRRRHSNPSWGIKTRWACTLLPPRTHKISYSRHGSTPTEVAVSILLSQRCLARDPDPLTLRPNSRHSSSNSLKMTLMSFLSLCPSIAPTSFSAPSRPFSLGELPAPL